MPIDLWRRCAVCDKCWWGAFWMVRCSFGGPFSGYADEDGNPIELPPLGSPGE